MNIKRDLVVMLLCLSAGLVFSGTGHITEADLMLMPYPAAVELKEGKFRLTSDFAIATKGSHHQRLYAEASRFMRRLDGRTGQFFKQEFVTKEPVALAKLIIKVDRPGEVKLHEDESYILSVTEEGIVLSAENDLGAIRGLETLLQLLMSDDQGYFFPHIKVEDEPRFPWRGLMIDVARHFQPIHVIKRNIDAMAAVKMNVLHLHLCDDQGFRVESKVYPQLHEKASDGQYFTQQEIRDIVVYAGQRGIRVVPEFDVPGHATSWLVAFPELASAPGLYQLEKNSGIFDPTLNPIKEKTYEVLDKLFGEMAELFPDHYFHIGGDENEGKHWDENEEIQRFMKKNNIDDNHELQTYFNTRLLKSLEKYNKKMIGWDEILQPDLPKSAVIHSWRGREGLVEAAKKGHQTILSNGYYIDLMHPTYKHYLNDPLPEDINLPEEQQKNVLGGEATMWSELVTPVTIDSRIWPRTAAIAERLWSPATVKDLDHMYKRLENISFRLEELQLTHIKNRGMIMRNLTNGMDTESLRVLIDVVEPLKAYRRNPGGTMYTTYSPYVLFADAAVADAPDARKFNRLVDRYLYQSEEASADEIIRWMELWSTNHKKLKPVIAQSPVLKSVETLSGQLSEIADIGLEVMRNEAVERNPYKQLQWYNDAIATLRKSREQGARTTLQVVDAIEKLVKSKSAILGADYTRSNIKIDGDLADWERARWDYFVPANHYGWNDTCYFAIRWDDKQLYFAFKVQNLNLQAQATTRDETGLHMDDGVEFLIDTDHDRSLTWEDDDLAYHINAANVIMDDSGTLSDGEFNNGWNGQAKTAVKLMGSLNDNSDEDEGYHVEVAISWKELGKKPVEELVMGIDLCVNDRDDDSSQYRYFDYMNLRTFHVPAHFARLVLTNKNFNQSTSFEQE